MSKFVLNRNAEVVSGELAYNVIVDPAGNLGRDGEISRYDLKLDYAATPVVRVNAPERDSVPVRPGVWETSGIIDAEHFYGRNSWLFVVRAHPPVVAPAPNTSEDGQLLLLLPARCNER